MRAEPLIPELVMVDEELEEELLEICDEESYLTVMSTAQRSFALGLLP